MTDAEYQAKYGWFDNDAHNGYSVDRLLDEVCMANRILRETEKNIWRDE